MLIGPPVFWYSFYKKILADYYGQIRQRPEKGGQAELDKKLVAHPGLQHRVRWGEDRRCAAKTQRFRSQGSTHLS